MVPATSPNNPMAMNSRLAMITGGRLSWSRAPSSEQVDGAEQAQPDDVDEVPVVGGHLDGVVVAGGELPRAGPQQHDQDERGPAGHVGAVEPGQGVEGRAEHPAGQGRALADQGPVLVRLPAQEGHAQQQADDQPQHQLALVVAADRPHPQLHGHARGDQDGREHGRVPGLQADVGALGGPLGGRAADGEVGPEQAAEEHHLGGDEQDHAQQRGADAAWLVMLLGRHVVEGGGVYDGHQRAPVVVASGWTVSSSAWRRSNSGRSEWISGRLSKLCAGGGEEVYHSRVLPSQGSSGSFSLRRMVITTLARNGAVDRAMIRAPRVWSWLRPTQSVRAKSTGGEARNTPSMPPIRNMVRNPMANSIAVEKVIWPLTRVAIQLKNLTPVGTAIRKVMMEKNGSSTWPVTNMWWAQTLKPRAPMPAVANTNAL